MKRSGPAKARRSAPARHREAPERSARPLGAPRPHPAGCWCGVCVAWAEERNAEHARSARSQSPLRAFIDRLWGIAGREAVRSRRYPRGSYEAGESRGRAHQAADAARELEALTEGDRA